MNEFFVFYFDFDFDFDFVFVFAAVVIVAVAAVVEKTNQLLQRCVKLLILINKRRWLLWPLFLSGSSSGCCRCHCCLGRRGWTFSDVDVVAFVLFT